MIRFKCIEVHDFTVSCKYVFSVTTPDSAVGSAVVYCTGESFQEGKTYEVQFQEVASGVLSSGEPHREEVGGEPGESGGNPGGSDAQGKPSSEEGEPAIEAREVTEE